MVKQSLTLRVIVLLDFLKLRNTALLSLNEEFCFAMDSSIDLS